MSDEARSPAYDVAVIGFGFAGLATLAHVVRAARRPLRIAVIAPDASGHGLGYGTRDLVHLLNVPAEKLGIWAHAPGDFARWLATADAARHAARLGVAVPGPKGFAARALFACYLAAVRAGDRQRDAGRVRRPAPSGPPRRAVGSRAGAGRRLVGAGGADRLRPHRGGRGADAARARIRRRDLRLLSQRADPQSAPGRRPGVRVHRAGARGRRRPGGAAGDDPERAGGRLACAHRRAAAAQPCPLAALQRGRPEGGVRELGDGVERAPGPHGAGGGVCARHHTGIGVAADAQHRVAPGVFALGNPLIGQLWESVAIPEIRDQAAVIAAQTVYV